MKFTDLFIRRPVIAIVVSLTRQPINLATIAQQLGIARGMLSRWVDATRPSPAARPTEDERSELARLRRENLQLRMERDILKKATAFFARQSE